MPVIVCPKCRGNLKVPEKMSARKVKCPGCQHVFMSDQPAAPPSSGVRRSGGSKHQGKSVADLLGGVKGRGGGTDDFEVVDEEPSRGDGEFDFEDDEPPRSGRRRQARDEYDEEEDDRPRRKRRGQTGKLGKAYTYDQLNRAKIGTLLFFIAMLLYGGSLAVMLLFHLLAWAGMSISNGLYILAALPAVGNWLLVCVGVGFCIAGPGKHGAMGMAIALASVAGIHFILAVVASSGSGGFVWPMLVTQVEGLTDILPLAVNGGLDNMSATHLLAALFELARMILLMFFLMSLAECVRDSSTSGGAMGIMIALPSVIVGLSVIKVVIIEAFKGSRPTSFEEAESLFSTLRTIEGLVGTLTLGALAGIMAWAAVVCKGAMESVERRM